MGGVFLKRKQFRRWLPEPPPRFICRSCFGLSFRRNFGLHLKDHDNKTRTDVVFGRGVLNVGAILRALREAKFGGYIAIEYEANPNNPTPDIRACLDVFRDAVRKLA